MTKEYVGIWRNENGHDIVVSHPRNSPEELENAMANSYLKTPYTIHEIGPALQKRTMYEVCRKEGDKAEWVHRTESKQEAMVYVKGVIAYFLEKEGPSYLTVTDQGEYVSFSTEKSTVFYEIKESADWILSESAD